MSLLDRLQSVKEVNYTNRHNCPLAICVVGDHLHVGLRTSYHTEYNSEIELIDCHELNEAGLKSCLIKIDNWRRCYRCLELYSDADMDLCVSCHLETSVNEFATDKKQCGICDKMEKGADFEITVCCKQALCKYCVNRLLNSNCPFCNSEIF